MKPCVFSSQPEPQRATIIIITRSRASTKLMGLSIETKTTWAFKIYCAFRHPTPTAQTSTHSGISMPDQAASPPKTRGAKSVPSHLRYHPAGTPISSLHTTNPTHKTHTDVYPTPWQPFRPPTTAKRWTSCHRICECPPPWPPTRCAVGPCSCSTNWPCTTVRFVLAERWEGGRGGQE